MVYLITFDYRLVSIGPNQLRAPKALVEHIKTLGSWARVTDRSWLLDTEIPYHELANDHVKPFLADKDFFLVVQLSAQDNYEGWLPQEVWKWLNQHLKGWAR